MGKILAEDAVDKAHERRLRRLAAKVNQDPGWKNAHYTLDIKDNPVARALKQALEEQRKRKIN